MEERFWQKRQLFIMAENNFCACSPLLISPLVACNVQERGQKHQLSQCASTTKGLFWCLTNVESSMDFWSKVKEVVFFMGLFLPKKGACKQVPLPVPCGTKGKTMVGDTRYKGVFAWMKEKLSRKNDTLESPFNCEAKKELWSVWETQRSKMSFFRMRFVKRPVAWCFFLHTRRAKMNGV